MRERGLTGRKLGISKDEATTWGARSGLERGQGRAEGCSYRPTGYAASGINSHCGKRKYNTHYRPGAATTVV